MLGLPGDGRGKRGQGMFAQEASEDLPKPNAGRRWPANLILNDTEEIAAMFPAGRSAGHYPSDSTTRDGVTSFGGLQGPLYDDTGSSARFFYAVTLDNV